MAWLIPLARAYQAAGPGERSRLLDQAARQHGYSRRQIQRLLDRLAQARQPEADLARRPRRDLGTFRLPPELQQMVVGLWMLYPRYSAPRIRRVLELNDPSLLLYRPYPNAREVNRLSPGTIRRIRQLMEADPVLRATLMDDKARKEHLRVWSGHVLTERANQLWMVDMTRCDTFVYDPYSNSVLRLRIHAAIDVFSGAVAGFTFSRDEDQAATDRMLMLALLEKPQPWDQHWPVWGRPDQIYWDNGKVYRSEKSERILSDLEIESVHSRPYVSHSRGNIERFFGLFHQQFEAGLSGYAGSDVHERDHQQIARYLHNTRRWMAQCGPDPYPERLLTEEEFKYQALLWLTRDYHKSLIRGSKTREEWFVQTAPAASRAQYHFGDLMLLFARQEKRRVRGNGTITLRGRPWGLADGSLVRYQGMEVVVLINEILPAAELSVALPRRDGTLEILGPLQSQNWNALGDEAREHRRKLRQHIRDIHTAADEIRAQFMNPTYRHDQALERAAPELPKPEIQPLQISGPQVALATHSAAQREAEEAVADFLAQGFTLDDELDLSPRPDTGSNGA
ncbi:DDE-type integrase/transposase/recombinase [uncultured Meiothermus sp.]|uniref:DDE-type integrase/transposase/recombinase n=1 Tax=uncultured Meiothermus sp. TaxID=157471 RepID=UPI0026081383|nr:DDE-type integrase/transposase/recombinase [uncultured Meiothermus sp.]